MIIGLGIDVVEVDRIREAMKDPKFVQRILTEKEIELCPTPEQVAGRWAAKEALAKAIPGLVRWHDAEILRAETGAPIPHVKAEYLPESSSIHLSISHEKGIASAVAVVEKA